MRKSARSTRPARSSTVNRRLFYQWRDRYPEFAEAVAKARDIAIDQMEQMAFKRALQGSDYLLMNLFRGLKPEVYTPRQWIEHDISARTAEVERELEDGRRRVFKFVGPD